MSSTPREEDDARASTSLGPHSTQQAPRFLLVGVASFIVDIGSLKMFHGVLNLGLALSTVLAFALAFSVNFTTSRQWVFKVSAQEGSAQHQVARYLVLVGINLGLTLVIVVGLSAVGVPYLLAKVVATGINAVGNFFAYRHWVFAAPQLKRRP